MSITEEELRAKCRDLYRELGGFASPQAHLLGALLKRYEAAHADLHTAKAELTCALLRLDRIKEITEE